MSLARFFIDRPIFAAVIALFICLGGALAIPFLAIAQYPIIAPPGSPGSVPPPIGANGYPILAPPPVQVQPRQTPPWPRDSRHSPA